MRAAGARTIRLGVFGAALALAACAEEPIPEETAAASPAEPERVLVGQVDSVEIGRTHDGYLVSATGRVQGEGWTEAELTPRGTPSSGQTLSFDFTAIPPRAPDAEGPAAEAAARRVQRLRADAPVPTDVLEAAAGVVVHGSAGAVVAPPPPSLAADAAD